MRSRRRAREAALQALYQCDALEEWTQDCVDLYWRVFQTSPVEDEAQSQNCEFAKILMLGVIEHMEFIDGRISAASTHWSVARMSRVDRNILRVACYEMAFREDIPVSVSINEAIEISKLYGSDDSPMFVNGVLDNVARTLAQDPILANKVKPRAAVANG